MPLISVLIPIYNGIEFLDECLQSVVAQTFTDWEVLIGVNGHGVMGGDVAVVANRWSEQDSRIRVYVQGPPLKGKVESLNHLLVLAKADWIAVLDCDDKWTPTKLQQQVEALQGGAKDADVIGTHCQIFGDRTTSPELPCGYIDPVVLENYDPIINSSSVTRRKWCHWEYNAINEYAIEDYYLWMRICLEGGRLYNVPEKLTWHRVYATSAFNSRHISNAKLLEWYRAERQKQ